MTIGSVGIWLVVLLAVVAVAGDRLDRSRPGPSIPAGALWGAATVAACLVARLAIGFATEDWTLVYVADNTRAGLNPLLRMAGVWAGPEGSLLMWTAMVSWAAVLASSVAGRRGGVEARRWARRLGGGLVALYAFVVAVVDSPFDRLAVPAVNGRGLQPVLEYPAMIWHPPILYAGLVGLLVPTLVAGAEVLSGRPPSGGRRLLGWPLALLTLGLLTGALWADVELGWGGYWAWDPIESAGLVAWCCGAAALHGLRSGGDRPDVVAGRPAVALALAPGVAAIWATTITRVGLVTSVHAFADRPGLRLALLLTAAAVSLAAIVILAAPPGSGSGSGSDDGRHRRLAVAVLASAGLFVAVGAYEPLVEAGTTGDAVAIAGWYYSRLLWPVVMFAGAVVVRAERRWWPAVAGTAVAALTTPGGAGFYAVALAAVGGAVAASGAARLVGAGPRSSVARGAVARGAVARGAVARGAVAHIGAGLLVVGVAGTMAGRVTVVDAPVGVVVRAGELTVVHRSVELAERSAVREAIATVEVDGTVLRPRLVSYPLRGVSTSEVAHRYRGLDELQVLLVDGDAEHARYQVNVLPRVGLVWLGGTVAALGLMASGLVAGGRGATSTRSARVTATTPGG